MFNDSFSSDYAMAIISTALVDIGIRIWESLGAFIEARNVDNHPCWCEMRDKDHGMRGKETVGKRGRLVQIDDKNYPTNTILFL